MRRKMECLPLEVHFGRKRNAVKTLNVDQIETNISSNLFQMLSWRP